MIFGKVVSICSGWVRGGDIEGLGGVLGLGFFFVVGWIGNR